ncbi:hypothetical protein M427DRAFT_137566 [Gonapodya prolifera JEL478]|uniref:1-alkyl-2-acetylglycerophosphocholine esterase n=1 Tax=Gonapodya prolifera (strain JEL478) TaxID=1344416 RepID=A0A139A5S2_GONPJ|nr:hypothetical protein M427DRAFT_137566 [Gonapodya prolifera JEL478]|eukprot:KXS11999.1 hypothetical protein M427DRAFT_137566 [Gonapodya prolifera JEL478]
MSELTLEKSEERPTSSSSHSLTSLSSSRFPSSSSGVLAHLKRIAPPHLPSYRGPYSVAVHDIEIPYSALPDAISTTSPPLVQTYDPTLLDTSLFPSSNTYTADTVSTQSVFLRVFYPSTGTRRTTPRQKLRKPYWQPSVNYARGLATFAKMPNWVAYVGIYPVFSFATVPATVDADLLNPPATDDGAKDAFPVVVFSHGLAGNKTMYSDLCGEMASRGSVVVAIEHHDGTATAADLAGGDVIYYHHPTWPDSNHAASFSFRGNQIQRRVREVHAALWAVWALNTGTTPGSGSTSTATSTVRHPLAAANLLEGTTGSEFDYAQFRGRLDLDRLVMAGHSFGGATVMAVLAGQDYLHSDSSSPTPSTDDAPSPPTAKATPKGWLGLGPTVRFTAAIAYDPWMFPVGRSPSASVPILSINSETFHWADNLRRLRHLFPVSDAGSDGEGGKDGGKKTLTTKTKVTPQAMDMPQFVHPLDLPRDGPWPAANPASRFLTLVDTRHHSFSDIPVIAPSLARRMNMSGTRDPVEVASQIARITARWLGSILPGTTGFVVAPWETTEDKEQDVLEGVDATAVEV